MFEVEEYGYGLKEPKASILKPEFHEGFDNLLLGTPGHGMTYSVNLTAATDKNALQTRRVSEASVSAADRRDI